MVAGGPAVQLAVVAATVVGLWVGARLLVDASVRLARGLGLSEFVIGLTIVAMGTSTPELAVTTEAAYKGLGDLAVANVLGSNVYNLAFILGLVAAIQVVRIDPSSLRRDGLVLIASTAIGALVLADRVVTRPEGVVLVVLFVAYTGFLLKAGRNEAGEQSSAEPVPTSPIARRLALPGRTVLFLLGGLAIVVVSGDLLIGATTELARAVGISEWVIGGTIVAAGTSTPEFAVSMVAIKRGSTGVSVGNVIGSNVFNLVGIVGVAALVRPLAVSESVFVTLGWLAVVSVLVVGLLWTDAVLSRIEGLVLTGTELVRWVVGLIG